MPRLTFPKYTLIVVLVVVAAFFIYFPSYSRYRELKIEAERLEAQLQTLQQQVSDLQREKQLIRTDKNYLESVIRKELGLVEPGEVVYEFEKTPSRKASRTPKAAENVSQPVTASKTPSKATLPKSVKPT